ncbi:MAG TPA: helix-turn-helix transcriptional regulator [Candidatus Obscuribacter sp.]|nr:helix-turn-helix transcriptional regulator [Candidatus Obscuribacter sp.]
MQAEKRAYRRLGRNISKRRLVLRLRQQDLAALIGADPSTISKMERGEMPPSIKWLLLLAAALETTVSELVEGIDRPTK